MNTRPMASGTPQPLRFPGRLAVVIAAAFGICTTGIAATLDRDGAYALLNQRTGANRANFNVYLDADSAFNHGSPTGLSGATSKIHLDPACLDDPSAANGCSSDLNRLDRLRGNVFRITFDALGNAEQAGVSIEEPAGWSVKGTGKGYDLTGATSLVLDVRSPSVDGADVQFGVGGQMTGFTHIPHSDTFSTVTIPLQSLALSPAAMSDMHVLFSVSTDGSHASNGGTILVDNVRFLPAPDARQQALGFPVASETFGVIPATSALPGRVQVPIDQAIRNAAPIEDSALTLLALIDHGTPADLANARVIADAFHYALHHDSQGRSLSSRLLPLPMTVKSDVAVRNGYHGGDLALLNNDAVSAALADDDRLAGYSGNTQLCGSPYCVVLDGASGQSVAFAILALVAANEALGDAVYLTDADSLGTWIFNELTDPSTAGFGGYYLGYADRDNPGNFLQTKPLQNNALIFAALNRLGTAEQLPRLNIVGGSKWFDRANVAGDFAMRLFDADSGRFYAGTTPAGTSPSFAVTPSGRRLGNDVVNTFDSVEANTLAVLALASSARYRGQIDWRKPVQWLTSHALTVTANGKTYAGFGFDPATADGPAGISWALTAQAIVAMRLVDCTFGGSFQDDVSSYSSQIALAQSSAPFGDGKGIVGSTLANGDLLSPADQCLSTTDGCLAERVGLAPTAWSLFADRERNPLSPSGTAAVCIAPKRRAAR